MGGGEKMKRIYLALMTVIVSLGLAGGTTFAVWSDTVTVTNNQVQTGTADLQVSTQGVGGAHGILQQKLHLLC